MTHATPPHVLLLGLSLALLTPPPRPLPPLPPTRLLTATTAASTRACASSATVRDIAPSSCRCRSSMVALAAAGAAVAADTTAACLSSASTTCGADDGVMGEIEGAGRARHSATTCGVVEAARRGVDARGHRNVNGIGRCVGRPRRALDASPAAEGGPSPRAHRRLCRPALTGASAVRARVRV